MTIDHSLRLSCHIDNIVTKASARSALILRCFKSREPKLLLKAFDVYVRPVLEYCCQVWNPSYKCDINKIEAVQRRFTKKMCGFRDLTYGERLSKLNRESLEERRLKADLALVYCSLHEKCAVQFSQLFVTAK